MTADLDRRRGQHRQHTKLTAVATTTTTRMLSNISPLLLTLLLGVSVTPRPAEGALMSTVVAAKGVYLVTLLCVGVTPSQSERSLMSTVVATSGMYLVTLLCVSVTPSQSEGSLMSTAVTAKGVYLVTLLCVSVTPSQSEGSLMSTAVTAKGVYVVTLLCVSVTPSQSEGSLMSTVVTAKGVYLVTLHVDPSDQAELRLLVNGRDVEVVAYGHGGMSGGVSVALPLRAGDSVRASSKGSVRQGGLTTMGLALVSNDTTDFTTYQSDVADSKKAQRVPFDHYLDYRAEWTRLTPETYIYIVNTGLHWVMARPDCGLVKVTVDVGPDLFKVTCNEHQRVLSSGAFYLNVGTLVKMVLVSGRYLAINTFLSIVFLPFNQRPYLTSLNHVAFTAWVKTSATYRQQEKIAFEGAVKTDYGGLYHGATRSWLIPVTGHYVIGLHGHPVTRNRFRLSVQSSEDRTLESFSQDGGRRGDHVMTLGQDAVFVLRRGDLLTLLADQDTLTVTPTTRISIALLKQHD